MKKRGGVLFWLALGGLFLALGALALLLSSRNAAWHDALGAIGLFLTGAVAQLWAFVPIAGAELLILAVPIAVLVLLIVVPLRRGFGAFLRLLSRIVCVACALLFWFALVYGVQYHAPPLSEEMGFSVGQYEPAQLQALTASLAAQLNTLAAQVPRDADGAGVIPTQQDIVREVAEGYRTLHAQYPDAPFDADRSATRRTVLIGPLMSYVGVAGFYFPFTGEGMINSDGLATDLPFDAAHEAAHRMGIGPEDEANFTAFLVCMQSDAAAVQYAGLFNGYLYAQSALYKQDAAAAQQINATLSQQVWDDFAAHSAHLAQYDTAIREAGQAVNDSYIQATGQPEGLQSYGGMVDLLLGFYAEQMPDV